MVRKNTPDRAFYRFHNPIEKALGCITARRLLIPQRGDLVLGRHNSIVLADGDPVPLGSSSITLSVIHEFKIIHDDTLENGPYKVRTLQYQYQFATSDGDDLITFHWTPEAKETAQKKFPHMHIGTKLLANDTPMLPGRLNKAHIPTARVSIKSVVRFAIEEIGVRPLRKNWHRDLETGDATFQRWSRRPD